MQSAPIYDKCWIWLGPTDADGYGLSRIHGVRKRVHIIYYEYYFGKVEKGYELHHECQNKTCYHPFHVNKLTKKQHRQLRKFEVTHCPIGHPYDVENTYWYLGNRQCKICRVRRNKERYI